MPLIKMPVGGRELLEVEGNPLTESEIAAVRERNVPVAINALPAGLKDLSFLAPISDALTQLTIRADEIANLTALATFPGLCDLEISPSIMLPLDLSTSKKLTSYTGRFDADVKLPTRNNFEYLELHGHSFQSLVNLQGQATVLRITSDKKSVDLSLPLPHSWRGTLTEITLRDFRSVATADLDKFSALRRLSICGAKSVANSAELRLLNNVKVDIKSRCSNVW